MVDGHGPKLRLAVPQERQLGLPVERDLLLDVGALVRRRTDLDGQVRGKRHETVRVFQAGEALAPNEGDVGHHHDRMVTRE